jgi:hypothetical protein
MSYCWSRISLTWMTGAMSVYLGMSLWRSIGVGEKGVGKCLDGVAGESADGCKGWQLIGSSAEDANFDRDSFHGRAEQAKDERDVRIQVVVHIEAGTRLAGVEDGDLDHIPRVRLRGGPEAVSGWIGRWNLRG